MKRTTKELQLKKVIAYIRVSTEEQATEGVSLAAQESKVRQYCDLYELDLVDVISDPGVSAKSLRRPGIQEALRRLRAGEVTGLVVAKLDRLTRSVSDMDSLIRDYFGERAKHEARLLSVADQVDTHSASGRLVLNVLMSVAQWERETIGERTREALAHKRSKNEKLGPDAPYGQQVAPDGIHLEPNPPEQATIATVLDLRASGLSQRKVVEALAARGIQSRAARPFGLRQVQRILKRNAA